MISGFESDIAILLLAVAILFSFGLGWWTYRDQAGVKSHFRYLMMGLRGASILLLIVLLFNPVLERRESRLLKQQIAVLIDNSRSMAIEKGNWNGTESMDGILDVLQLSDTSRVRYKTFGFDRDLFPSKVDSLDYNGSVTDINRSLQSLGREDASFNAVILVTDGIFNRGLDPTTTALRMGMPFFTIAAGDSGSHRDLVVRNVFYNPSAFTNTIIPVNVEILNDGFPNRSFEIQVYVDGILAETRTVFTTSERSVHQEEFELQFSEEGTKTVRVHVPELEGEWTDANNTYTFTIDVKDDQIRVMHLAFEMHPDVGALRHLLATDESIIPDYRTWISGSRFVEGSLPVTADTLDLVILHGFPHGSVPNDLASDIREFITGANVMFITLPGSRLDRLGPLSGNIQPIQTVNRQAFSGILPEVSDRERDHTILDLNIPQFSRAPELSGPFGGQQPSPNARVLLQANYRGSSTGIPFLAISETGNQRFSQINAHNWFRWKQSTQAEFREFYSELFNNVIKWTSSDPDSPILDLQPARQQFTEGDAIVFRAAVRTETGAPDTEARVELRIEGGDAEPGNYTMRNIGAGRFTLETRDLPAGSYSYTGTAYRGNTLLETVSGSFTVTESILEYLDTQRRDDLLRFIATESGGAYFAHENLDGFRERLAADGFLDYQTETYLTLLRFHQHYWWFMIVLMLLTTEWIFRKRFDLA